MTIIQHYWLYVVITLENLFRILPEGVVSKNDMGALTILQSMVSCMVLGGVFRWELLLCVCPNCI